MSNLPPGVRVSDLPGNSRADAEWERMLDALDQSPMLGTEILSLCGLDLDRDHVYDKLAASGKSAAEILSRCGLDAMPPDEADYGDHE